MGAVRSGLIGLVKLGLEAGAQMDQMNKVSQIWIYVCTLSIYTIIIFYVLY